MRFQSPLRDTCKIYVGQMTLIFRDTSDNGFIFQKNNTRQESDDCGLSSRSEQRIKDLKRRNGELVALAKKLEEKAKRLQQELGVLVRINHLLF